MSVFEIKGMVGFGHGRAEAAPGKRGLIQSPDTAASSTKPIGEASSQGSHFAELGTGERRNPEGRVFLQGPPCNGLDTFLRIL